MKIYQLIFQREDYVSVETYKEFEYAMEQYDELVKLWKNKPNECSFIKERHEREFGYFRVAEFTNGITITIQADILREYKDKI